MDTRWYDGFFDDIVVEVWRQAIPKEFTIKEVDFLERALNLETGSSVLDVPCGTGRHAVELAARGHAVTGIDLSEQMIAVARQQAADAGIEVDWRCADMRDLPDHGTFDAGYCMGNSFGYLEPEGRKSFVRALAAALRPGARAVIDGGMAAECVLPNLGGREQGEVGDITVLEENVYHARASCYETKYTFIRGDETTTRSEYQWVYTMREIEALLGEARLIVDDVFSSIDGEPFEAGSRYYVLTARKTG